MNELNLLLGLACLTAAVLLTRALRRLQNRVGAGELQRQALERRVRELEAAAAGLRAGQGVEWEPVRRADAMVPVVPLTASAAQTVPVEREVAGSLPSLPPVLATHAATAGPAPTATETDRADAEAGTEAAAPASGTQTRPAAAFDWEQFMGARLFAWLGGLALFLGFAYFVKYSFERNLISPAGRVLIGLVCGVGLVAGGVRLRRREYAVTAQTLCATGVVILYAALFAGHAFYHLAWLPQAVTFGLMTAVTAVAFYLAVRMPALVVAVLGLVGGFLTPVLVSRGEDQAAALFTYIALLDAGLVAVALRRRWDFLVVLGAVGTVLLQVAWAAQHFLPEKVGAAWFIFAMFSVLFLLGLTVGQRRGMSGEWFGAAVVIAASVPLGFAGWLLGPGGFSDRPGVVFAFVLVADLSLLAVAWWRERLATVHVAGGLIAFGYLVAWMARSVTPGLMVWALGLTVGFAILHSAFPLVVERFKPAAKPRAGRGAQMFPAMAVAALIVPLLKLETPSLAIWPAVVLLNLLALALAFWSSGFLGAVIAVLASGLATAVWIGRLPADVGEIGGTLVVVSALAALFAAAGPLLARRRGESEGADELELFRASGSEAWKMQVPVLGILLPFLLLAQLVVHVQLPDPSVVFGVMLLVLAMLLGLAAWLRSGALPLAGLVGLALVELVWLFDESHRASRPLVAIGWFVLFHGVLALFPVVARRRVEDLRLPWVASALVGLPQFYLVYRLIDWFWPNQVMGLVPLAFAIPAGAMFAWVARHAPADPRQRLERLAWFGGVTLFFVTLALPIQLDRQWLTIGLACEGAALLWLFRRVPHSGLRATGVFLLAAVFARLVLNPWTFEYAVRGPVALWNWWLYTYGIAAAAMFVGAWLLRGPQGVIRKTNLRAVLVTFGTVLTFALVNVQIADLFTPVGEPVRFEFSGRFGRDMTYTIAWAVFALALVAIGLSRRVVGARWAGLGLLGVAVAKLFLHDLARLDQLYRVGALVGVALVAIAASVLYQRYVGRGAYGRS